jgi:TonB family protein
MSLSELCINQHRQEHRRLRKLLSVGLLGSVSIHAIAFGISKLSPWQHPVEAELSSIELIVVEPPIETPDAAEPAPLPSLASGVSNGGAPSGPAPATILASPQPAPAPTLPAQDAISQDLASPEQEQPEATANPSEAPEDNSNVDNPLVPEDNSRSESLADQAVAPVSQPAEKPDTEAEEANEVPSFHSPELANVAERPEDQETAENLETAVESSELPDPEAAETSSILAEANDSATPPNNSPLERLRSLFRQLPEEPPGFSGEVRAHTTSSTTPETPDAASAQPATSRTGTRPYNHSNGETAADRTSTQNGDDNSESTNRFATTGHRAPANSAAAGEGRSNQPRNARNVNGGSEGRGQGSRTVACQQCLRPEYPQSALEAGIEGQPRVNVEINPDGTVARVTLIRSSGNAAIDQAAIQAAQRSRFQPVAGGATVPIEYDLNIAGSQRHQNAQQRGERYSTEVPTPASSETPPATVVSPSVTETPVPAEESPSLDEAIPFEENSSNNETITPEENNNTEEGITPPGEASHNGGPGPNTSPGIENPKPPMPTETTSEGNTGQSDSGSTPNPTPAAGSPPYEPPLTPAPPSTAPASPTPPPAAPIPQEMNTLTPNPSSTEAESVPDPEPESATP